MTEGTLLMACVGCAVISAILIAIAVRKLLRPAESASQTTLSDLALEEANAMTMGQDETGMFKRFGKAFRPTEATELSDLKKLLAQAGRRGAEEVDTFGSMRVIALAIAAVLSAVFVVSIGNGAMPIVCMVLLIAFIGPKMWLRNQAEARQSELEMALPSTLDLLEACIEAGLGFEQALSRVASELGITEPAMADELLLVVGEVTAGLSVGASFRKLADRLGNGEFRSLCTVIIQSSSLGSPLGRALKEYAKNARMRRTLALEEKAGKVTASLTLPLTICLLPSAILVILGPAVVTIFEAMSR